MNNGRVVPLTHACASLGLRPPTCEIGHLSTDDLLAGSSMPHMHFVSATIAPDDSWIKESAIFMMILQENSREFTGNVRSPDAM